ncbi:MAG TPA: glycosyltransferase family 4 protein [Solirubrobacteraceae bacterium]|nr:glycosyltransferase family 4 protein [Solirubrobacteraceae bacterium]
MPSRLALRCAVIPPAPAPYREPLFEALAERLELRVIYQSATQPSWDAPPTWFEPRHRYPAVHLRSRQRARPGRTPIVWPIGLERALGDFQPHCVVAAEYGPASLRALAWCRSHGRAYVIFTECTPEIDPLLPAAQLALHRRLARHADGLIAVSSRARRRLEQLGARAQRIGVALQSADLRPVRAARNARDAARPLPERPLIVLAVARLVADKNLAALIQAFSAAGLAQRAATLRILGSGPLQEELRRLAARLGVDVQLPGALAPEAMPEEYASAHVFACVSTYEPFGVAIREACAAGLPLIVSRTAGAVDDVAREGRNAILVDPHRPPEIADALARLAGDAQLRRRLGEQSRAIDRETDGRDVDAFVEVVLAAAARRRRAGG